MFICPKMKPAVTPVIAFPTGNPMPVMTFALENPNSKAATEPPISPVNPPKRGPPKRAAMNVDRCDRSRANDTEIGPRGIDGIIGAILMDMKERTFPKAAITATKVRLLEPK